MTAPDPRAAVDAGPTRGLPPGGLRVLGTPTGLRAVPGRGHVMLDWDPVPGAAGYLVYSAADPESSDGPFEPVDHGGGDVLAVPGGPYADTTGQAGQVRYYAVADGQSAGPLSDPVAAAPVAAAPVEGGPVGGAGLGVLGMVTVEVSDVGHW
jgi:xylan 1,4-beta-xylosidase